MAFVQAGAELMDMLAAAVREHGDMNQFAQLSPEQQIDAARHWDIFALAGLAGLGPQTAETAKTIVQDRVYAVLAHLVAPPDRLMRVMRDTKTVLADRHIHAIIHPDQPPATENFLFHSPAVHWRTFCIFFLDVLHAKEVTDRDEIERVRGDDAGPGFEEYAVLVLNGRKIVITESNPFSPLEAVPWKKATNYMNVLSSRCIYIAYPWLMQSKRGRIREDVEDRMGRRWRRQGWNLRKTFRAIGTHHADCLDGDLCPQKIRYLGDENTLVLLYDCDADAYPEDSVTVMWVLGGQPCGTDNCHTEIVRQVGLATLEEAQEERN
ncbi:hypothetical protein EIP86_010024 [Pleurotus ostreatoroseus]|nr:hypothetical protein EIP86_010024 [Pleurotus ostreatoroseus]